MVRAGTHGRALVRTGQKSKESWRGDVRENIMQSKQRTEKKRH